MVKLRLNWYRLTNWLNGYAWSPVRRCATCKHTWPEHYEGCASW